MQLQPIQLRLAHENIWIPLLAVHRAEKTREISLEILWRSFLLSVPAPATLGFDSVSNSRPSHCLDSIFIRTDIVLLFEDKVYFFIVAAHYTLINISHALGDLSIQGWESFSLATSVLCFIKQTDRTFTDWINVWASFLAINFPVIPIMFPGFHIWYIGVSNALKSQVLHTVQCNISGEAAGDVWHRSLLGAKGLKTVKD